MATVDCKEIGRLTGNNVTLMLVLGCGSRPSEADWRIAGLATGKTMDTNPNTTNSAADSLTGVVETIVTTADPTVSLDGEIDRASDADVLGFQELLIYFNDCLAAKRQPGVWVRWIAGGVQMEYQGVITGLSESGSRDDIATYSAEFKVMDATTFSVTALKDVTGITIDSDTKTAEVGDTYQVGLTFAPTDATIQVAQYSSSNTAVATVDFAGNVTVLAAGVTIITARSVDGGFTQTQTLTAVESGS